MLVPFLKLVKDLITSWLIDSTDCFHVLENPRTNWVMRAAHTNTFQSSHQTFGHFLLSAGNKQKCGKCERKQSGRQDKRKRMRTQLTITTTRISVPVPAGEFFLREDGKSSWIVQNPHAWGKKILKNKKNTFKKNPNVVSLRKWWNKWAGWFVKNWVKFRVSVSKLA